MFAEIMQKGLYATKIVPGAESVPIIGVILLVIGAYLLGSLNSAVIVSRLLFGEDIRRKGSGNAGLTNMFRIYGKKAALFTLIGDILKAVVAVFLAALFFGFSYRAALSFSPACYIAGLACIIGHIKPIFYGFRGGKGVLSSATVILMLCPPVFLSLIAIFVLIVWATRYISLGSIVSAAALPLLLQGYMQAFIFTGDPDAFFEGGIVLFGLAFALIVIICHRANIKRLWHHEENKFSFHRSTPKAEEDGDGK